MLTLERLRELQMLDADVTEQRLLLDSAAVNWGQGDSPARKKLARAWTTPQDRREPTGRARVPAAARNGDAMEALARAEAFVAAQAPTTPHP